MDTFLKGIEKFYSIIPYGDSRNLCFKTSKCTMRLWWQKCVRERSTARAEISNNRDILPPPSPPPQTSRVGSSSPPPPLTALRNKILINGMKTPIGTIFAHSRSEISKKFHGNLSKYTTFPAAQRTSQQAPDELLASGNTLQTKEVL